MIYALTVIVFLVGAWFVTNLVSPWEAGYGIVTVAAIVVWLAVESIGISLIVGVNSC